MANILFLSCDLMLPSHAASVAKQQDVPFRSIANLEKLVSQLAQQQASLVVIDLEAIPGPFQETIAKVVSQIREASPAARIIAFGPHVHKQKLQLSQEAGCDLVLSRGAFHSQLESLFQEQSSEQ